MFWNVSDLDETAKPTFSFSFPWWLWRYIRLGFGVHMGVSENWLVPLNPMVLLIIIPIKWLFHWDIPNIFRQTHMMISLWFLPATKTADRDEPKISHWASFQVRKPSTGSPNRLAGPATVTGDVIWMTVWAPRMLKWDWNGIEMGMDQNLSAHVTYVTLYFGSLLAILVWRP